MPTYGEGQEAFKDAKIRIMPDCHAGKSCVVGFTADFGEKIIPNIVGVDIGCGMLTVELGNIDIEFERLDQVIRENIPFGREVNKGRKMKFPKMQEMYCYRALKDSRGIERAIGTLGGGNHFIEIDTDDDGCKYLVIHTGSRQLGKQTAEYHQKVAGGLHTGWGPIWDEEERIKKEFKAAGRRSEIRDELKKLHAGFQQTAPDIPLDFAYLEGKYSEHYLHDMEICQEFADANRKMKEYDAGDGKCVHLTDENLCDIYDRRPDICNVEKMYEMYFCKVMDKSEYEYMNVVGCTRLRNLYEKEDLYRNHYK